MGKRYCFFCRDCEIKLTLFGDVGKNSKQQLLNYYCPHCEKIVYQNVCLDCNRILEKTFDIPKNIQKESNYTSKNIDCPRCNSFLTVIAFLGEWV